MIRFSVDSAADLDVRESRVAPGKWVVFRRATGHAVESPRCGGVHSVYCDCYFHSEQAARDAIPDWIDDAQRGVKKRTRRDPIAAFVNSPVRTLAQEMESVRAYTAKRDVDPWHGWRPPRTAQYTSKGQCTYSPGPREFWPK